MNSIRFDNPQALWLLLLAGPMIALGLRSLATLEPVRRYTALALRLLVLTLLVLLLAGLQSVQRHSDLTVMAVIDQSESVRRFGSVSLAAIGTSPDQAQGQQRGDVGAWLREFLRLAAGDKKPDDRFGLVVYDGRPTVGQLPSTVPDFNPALTSTPVEGTDSAAALRLAMAMFPPDSGKRLIWASDGNDTTGSGIDGAFQAQADLLTVAREARAAGIRIDVLPIDYHLDGEVMVEGVYTPTEAREGQTAAVRIVLRAARPTEGTLYLRHDQATVDLTPDHPGHGAAIFASDWTIEQSVSAQPEAASDAPGRFVLVRSVDLPLFSSGTNRFEAVFEPKPPAPGEAPQDRSGHGEPDGQGDVVAANNRAESFTLVHGRSRILLIDGVGGDSGRVLPQALAKHDLDVETRPANGFPGSLGQLQRYDAVLFQDVPAEALTPAQIRMLARYVHDLGGGFVMIGGPNSFGAGGWTHTPVDEILPVTCEIPSQTVLPSGALAIVLDRSGSMSSLVSGTSLTQQEVANEAAVYALSTLFPDDLVTVIAFDDSAKMVVPLVQNRNPAAIASQIKKITPGGGTNIYAGLEQAFNILAPLSPDDAAVRHIILLTDGHSQQGDQIGLARKLVQAGITLSTVGVGDGMNNQLLMQLAQMAGGHFYPIVDPRVLPQIFIKEARTIRKNLIREIPFDPQLVQTGSPIVTAMDGVPRLKGFVLTGEKRRLGVFQPIVGPEGEPIFAHGQAGLGRTAAFTSDATNRWASDWLRWPGYSDFWARTTRAIARPASSTEYDLVTQVVGDQLRVRLDLTGHRGQGGLQEVRGSLLGPDGEALPITLTQTGPGVYEATLAAEQAGSYIVSLFVQGAADAEGQGQPVSRVAVFGGASKPPGAELRRFSSNRAVLEEVARITGGRVLDHAKPLEAGLYARDVPFESRSVRPLWRPLLWTLLALFLLDVACRRIAWDPVAIGSWLRGVFGAVSARRPVGVEAGVTLEKLRQGASRRRAVPTEVEEQVPVASPSRKFEAAPHVVASDDLGAAIGAATAGEVSQRRVAEPAAVAAPARDEGPTTSRLLAAKRRAAERLDPKEPT